MVDRIMLFSTCWLIFLSAKMTCGNPNRAQNKNNTTTESLYLEQEIEKPQVKSVKKNLNTDTIYAANYNKKYPKDADLIEQLVLLASNDSKVIKLEGRIYKIRNLVFEHAVTIVGVPSKTIINPVANAIGGTLMNAHDKLSLSNVILDGENKLFWGIYSKSDLIVSNCIIKNFKGNDKAPGSGIRHLASSHKTKLFIEHCEFINISGFEDGKVGNYIGANRGILSTGGNVKILKSSFTNIEGKEDGDCIHIQTTSNTSDVWSSSGKVVIENCEFSSFGKRAVKIQASDVVVKNCKITNQFANKVNMQYAAISVYGSRNIIENNYINVNSATAAITITSGSDNKIVKNTIEIKQSNTKDKTWGIAFDKAIGTIITDNKFLIDKSISRSPFMFSPSIDKVTRDKMIESNQVNKR